ncbi:MAG: BTAD domain-containing putative transcriptional regulator, partial [Chloroflexota bacterium]
MLSIALLGSPEIKLDQQPLTISRRKSRALLYYLAAHPHPLTREQLLTFFWPNLDRRTAQQNFRVTLSGLKKYLDDYLIVTQESLALATEVQVDVRLFDARLATNNEDISFLKDTIALYRDDFLRGFSLPNLPDFEDWALLERQHFRHNAIKGFVRLSQQYKARNKFRTALEALNRAIQLDPLMEELQQLALQLHYLSGDRAGAIRRYEQLYQMLSEELGVPPMDETRTLYDAIITDTVTPALLSNGPMAAVSPPEATTQTTPAPLFGREESLQQLYQLVKTHKFILIEG